jgi:Holliday junction resolvase RusA-like endonuclease
MSDCPTCKGSGRIELPPAYPRFHAAYRDCPDCGPKPVKPIVIEVLGLPQPAGSKRGFAIPRKGQPIVKNGKFNGRVIISDANPKSSDWKETVKFAAVRAMVELDRPFTSPLIEGPLEVSMIFRMPRIKQHFRSNGLLKESAPARPTVRPDTLKLARGTEDALTGIVWRDDSQIVIERLEKVYSDKPGATITITKL